MPHRAGHMQTLAWDGLLGSVLSRLCTTLGVCLAGSRTHLLSNANEVFSRQRRPIYQVGAYVFHMRVRTYLSFGRGWGGCYCSGGIDKCSIALCGSMSDETREQPMHRRFVSNASLPSGERLFTLPLRTTRRGWTRTSIVPPRNSSVPTLRMVYLADEASGRANLAVWAICLRSGTFDLCG